MKAEACRMLLREVAAVLEHECMKAPHTSRGARVERLLKSYEMA